MQPSEQPSTTTGEHSGRRAAGEQGAVVVEFALISGLLSLIIFGIITFGLILSFKQDVTRAAAEGARAGAVALPSSFAFQDAWTATVEAVDSFGRTCGDNGAPGPDGMTCNVWIATCDQEPSRECVSVELSYNYDDHPLIAKLPILSGFLPDRIRAMSVARIND